MGTKSSTVLGLLLCAAWPLLAAPEALAQEASSATDLEGSTDARIAAIREMVLYARYADAESAVDELLARTDLSPAQRNAGLEVRAIILLARRQTSRADAVLRELYGRDPEHRLLDRDAGPEVRAAFERAHDQHPQRATVRLDAEGEPSLATRQSPPITVRVTQGADVVQELRLSYRNTDSGDFERVMMRLDEARTTARARIPLAEGTSAYAVQYFVEALAPSQVVVTSLGSASEPLSLSVPEEIAVPSLAIVPDGSEGGEVPAGPSVFEEWWFWTVVGVLVAGGAATVGALYGTHVIGPPGPGSLGEARL